MRFNKKWFIPSAIFLAITFNAHAYANDVHTAIDNGMRYLESVQNEYGEFPTTFTYDVTEPERSLVTAYSSIVMTTAMITDAIYQIPNKAVERMQPKSIDFIQSQLFNSKALWPFFTTHNPKPLVTLYTTDLANTVIASRVLIE